MKILVVDDHPLFLDGLKLVLSGLDKDIDFLQANDGEQALTLVADHLNELALVLVDLNLPGLDGVALITAFSERQYWIPTVMISAEENPRAIKAALDAGALGFIPKSYNAEELLNAARQVLKGELHLPENIRQQLERAENLTNKGKDDNADAARYGITPRQFSVLQLMAQGLPNKRIALTLNLTEHTVKAHVGALFSALNAGNRTECVQEARRLGLIDA
ncbi:MAG: response regulator transcription factor [Gammaproteobacteria bacterium]|nr:response regulator transcription factor [Gammaproteobacteria bacterium]